MKKMISVLSLTLVPVLIMVFTFVAAPARAIDYCADMEITSPGQPATPVVKTCIKDDKIRQEISQGGMQMIMIYRPDKKVTWTLMPMMKSYMERPYEEDTMVKGPESWQEDYKTLKKLGKTAGIETVNGVKCEKFIFEKNGNKLLYWISQKDKLPIRIVTGDTTINYKNFHIGNVPDSLFEIPTGYHKMNIPNMPQGTMPGGAGMHPDMGH